MAVATRQLQPSRVRAKQHHRVRQLRKNPTRDHRVARRQWADDRQVPKEMDAVETGHRVLGNVAIELRVVMGHAATERRAMRHAVRGDRGLVREAAVIEHKVRVAVVPVSRRAKDGETARAAAMPRVVAQWRRVAAAGKVNVVHAKAEDGATAPALRLNRVPTAAG